MVVHARRREPHAPIAQVFLDPGGEKHLRVQLGAVEFSSGQRLHRKYGIGHRDPCVAAIIGRDVFRLLRTMHDRRALPGEFGIDLYGNFVEICVEAGVGPFVDIAGSLGATEQLLRGAEVRLLRGADEPVERTVQLAPGQVRAFVILEN